jgi:hypothetical protein
MASRDEGGGGSQKRRLLNQPGAYTPPKNINLNQRDYDRIMSGNWGSGGQSSQPTPSGPAQDPIMVPKFSPRLTTADLINQDTNPPRSEEHQHLIRTVIRSKLRQRLVQRLILSFNKS